MEKKMSRQSEAKAKQNYQENALQTRCRTCGHYIYETNCGSPSAALESNRRCGIGGFAVKPNAICSEWTRKKEAVGIGNDRHFE
jgi:hypothetical protein